MNPIIRVFRAFDTAGEFNLANFFPALPSQIMVAVFLLSALHSAN